MWACVSLCFHVGWLRFFVAPDEFRGGVGSFLFVLSNKDLCRLPGLSACSRSRVVWQVAGFERACAPISFPGRCCLLIPTIGLGWHRSVRPPGCRFKRSPGFWLAHAFSRPRHNCSVRLCFCVRAVLRDFCLNEQYCSGEPGHTQFPMCCDVRRGRTALVGRLLDVDIDC